MTLCPVCESPNAEVVNGSSRILSVQCPRCGDYRITLEAIHDLPNGAFEAGRPKVSRWIRDQSESGVEPIVKSANFAQIRTTPDLSVTQKADRLLKFLVRATSKLGEAIHYGAYTELEAKLETFDSKEIEFLASYLIERGFARVSSQFGTAIVTVDGFAKVDEFDRSEKNASQVFIAMSFAENMASIWTDGLKLGVELAGYTPLRIDGKQHNNKICDEIVAEIRRSKFVVADFTGHRGGVYYEAGFASGFGLPVIYTCKKEELSSLHFDVRQYNTIDWSDAPELARRLEARICATVGDGPSRRKP